MAGLLKLAKKVVAPTKGRDGEHNGLPFAPVQEKNFSEQHPQPAPSNELHAAHMGEIVFSKSNILSAKSKLSDFTNSFGSGDNICARMYLKQPLALYPVEKGKWLCTTGEYEGVFVGDPTANAQSSQSGASSHVFLLFSFQVDGKNYCPAGKPGVVGEEYGQGNQEARDYLCANVKPAFIWNITTARHYELDPPIEDSHNRGTTPGYWSAFPIFLYPGKDAESQYIEDYRPITWAWVALLQSLKPGPHDVSINCTVAITESTPNFQRTKMTTKEYFVPLCSGSLRIDRGDDTSIHTYPRLLPPDFSPEIKAKERAEVGGCCEAMAGQSLKAACVTLAIGWIDPWKDQVARDQYNKPFKFLKSNVWIIFDTREPEDSDPELPCFCFSIVRPALPNGRWGAAKISEQLKPRFPHYEVRRSIVRAGLVDHGLVDMIGNRKRFAPESRGIQSVPAGVASAVARAPPSSRPQRDQSAAKEKQRVEQEEADRKWMEEQEAEKTSDAVAAAAEAKIVTTIGIVSPIAISSGTSVRVSFACSAWDASDYICLIHAEAKDAEEYLVYSYALAVLEVSLDIPANSEGKSLKFAYVRGSDRRILSSTDIFVVAQKAPAWIKIVSPVGDNCFNEGTNVELHFDVPEWSSNDYVAIYAAGETEARNYLAYEYCKEQGRVQIAIPTCSLKSLMFGYVRSYVFLAKTIQFDLAKAVVLPPAHVKYPKSPVVSAKGGDSIISIKGRKFPVNSFVLIEWNLPAGYVHNPSNMLFLFPHGSRDPSNVKGATQFADGTANPAQIYVSDTGEFDVVVGIMNSETWVYEYKDSITIVIE